MTLAHQKITLRKWIWNIWMKVVTDKASKVNESKLQK